MSEFEGDLEALGKLLRKVKQKPKKANKKQSSKQPSSTKVDPKTQPIVAEMKALGVGSNLCIAYKPIDSTLYQEVPPINVRPVLKEHRWTEKLSGFEEAKQSAVEGILHLLAQTKALQCSFNTDSAHIEQTLFQIRAGVIGPNDPGIDRLTAYARQRGKGREIHKRIDDALHDAERRKHSGETLSDLNTFRLTLCIFWTCFLFWLMSDDNIARFMAANKLVAEGFVCNPSTITKARAELQLVKSKRPIVKAVGPNFHWTFVEGYPPTP